jgi:hypothetical protein
MSVGWMAALVVLIVVNQSFHRSRGLVGSTVAFRLMVGINLGLIGLLIAWPWIPGVAPLAGAARGLVGLMIGMHVATAIQARTTLAAEASRERAEQAWAETAARLAEADDEK